jgi:phosphomevalonate kinase
MIARAPGKVVLSGAYAVLCGAPALVAAVDRYAIADTARTAVRTTPEIEAALARRAQRPPIPLVDATALRSRDGEDRKLGLGSSAAMLVAALCSLELVDEPDLDDDSLHERVFGPALQAHRTAQRGGSGIDVVASTFGGVRRCQLASDGAIEHDAVSLPAGIVIEIWSSKYAACTADMLRRFWALKDDQPSEFKGVIGELSRAAMAAADSRDARGFISASLAQHEAFRRLGDLAGSPIVTPAVTLWHTAASRTGAVALPSGAGGGDIVLWIGSDRPDARAIQVAAEAGLSPLSICIGARGAHCASSGERP